MKQSNGEELWEIFSDGRISSSDLIINQMRESVILEYKEVPADYREGKFRATVSRIVSGFANSAGGIVVWGVATGQGNNKDAPTSIPGVPDSEDFIRWLNSVIPNAVQPACVTHTMVIPSTGTTPTVVVTYIPQSELPPHQAVLETNKPYYTRLDGQFKVMEYHMLADMFGHRRHPSLILDVEHMGTKKQSDGPGFSPTVTISTFHFALRNEGRGPAKYPTAILTVNHGGSRTAWKQLSQYAKKYKNGSIEYSVGIDRIVYPATRIFLGQLEVTWYKLNQPVVIEGKIQAEDMVPRSASYTVDSQGNIQGQTDQVTRAF